MTLNKYQQIMNHIVVTDDMKQRILSHIAESNAQKRAKILPFSSYWKQLSIAACFVLLLVGAYFIPKFTHIGTNIPSEESNDIDDSSNNEMMTATYGITELADIEHLSLAVGFPIHELSELPFEATNTTYASYWDEMAEITYSGNSQTLCYRVSMGQEDNSGDYNIYELEKELIINELSVILKGQGDSYVLAVWNDKEYSYSLSFSTGVSEEAITNLIMEIYS